MSINKPTNARPTFNAASTAKKKGTDKKSTATGSKNAPQFKSNQLGGSNTTTRR